MKGGILASISVTLQPNVVCKGPHRVCTTPSYLCQPAPSSCIILQSDSVHIGRVCGGAASVLLPAAVRLSAQRARMLPCVGGAGPQLRHGLAYTPRLEGAKRVRHTARLVATPASATEVCLMALLGASSVEAGLAAQMGL